MKKLFTNDRFFLASTAISVIGMFTLLVTELISGQERLSYDLTLLAFPVCTMVLYITYMNHNKNVMKAMMGALLMALVLSDLSYTVTGDRFAPFFLCCDCLLFISHMLINSDRNASPARIRFNQCVVIAYLLIEIVWTVINLTKATTGFDYMFIFSSAFSYLATSFVIVCIESRLDAYRVDREVAGWTEEKGYPKGYIHRKDR